MWDVSVGDLNRTVEGLDDVEKLDGNGYPSHGPRQRDVPVIDVVPERLELELRFGSFRDRKARQLEEIVEDHDVGPLRAFRDVNGGQENIAPRRIHPRI